MASLVSPGVTTQLIDDSLFVPSVADTVPLFFFQTQQNKKQPDGISTALGTVQSNVVRTITSLKQSLTLFGTPSFLKSASGASLHGDSRNEVGLFALNRFLGIGSLAYAVRADINTDDEYSSTSASWISKSTAAAAELRSLTEAYVNAVNTKGAFQPGDTGYKDSVNQDELLTFIRQVMSPIFAENTFAKTEFDFYDNNHTPALNAGGFQTIDFGNGLTEGEVPTPTGLNNDGTLYKATISIDGRSFSFSQPGNLIQDVSALLMRLNGLLGAAGTAELTNGPNSLGNLKITSGTVGSNSTVIIADQNLFSSMVGFIGLNMPVGGATADSALAVFANGFNQPLTDEYQGMEGNISYGGFQNAGNGKWTPAQAAQELLYAAVDLFVYTAEFSNKTSLGATDIEKRQSIVTALQAVINSNTEVRSELYEYNLIVCPGFAEVVDDMLTLCEDIGEEAFVIGDVPYQLDPEAAANWAVAPASASNSRRVNRNVAYYYPHAIGSNIDGNDVFVPASAIALRTYAYSDQQSQVWFAPAGARRGTVTGISRIGYITGTIGQPTTFVDVALNKGQRDALYQYFSNINPIANLPGRGILVFGQKTSQSYASALDRVNVARLVAYIRRQSRKLGFGFLFEPNDSITRANFKSAIDGMLANVMMSRGLVDYLTVCDTSNNTPQRIGANELYLDIALKPMIAAEFIIIPITVKSQGASLAAAS
jgi:phage tail sheath protein FI